MLGRGNGGGGDMGKGEVGEEGEEGEDKGNGGRRGLGEKNWSLKLGRSIDRQLDDR